jgi:biotin carboxyl carrier protein
MWTLDLASGAFQQHVQASWVRTAEGGRLRVGEQLSTVTATQPLNGRLELTLDGVRHVAHVVQQGAHAMVHVAGRTWKVTLQDPLADAAQASAAADRCAAPMPGTVIALHVQPGDRVSSGQVLVVIESMKMQMNLDAARDGIVAEVCCQVGKSFERDAPLVRLQPAQPAKE